MKIQSRSIVAALLTAAWVVAPAQQRPSAPTQSAIAQRAEGLTHEQIDTSTDMDALSRLAGVYNSVGDMKRFTWTLHRLTDLLPDSGQLRLQLAMAYAEQNEKTNAYDVLVHMQGQGFGYDIANDSRFDKIRGTRVWDYIVANLQVNAKQFGEGKVAFELPKGDYLFESIGYDPARKKFLIGSAREGKVYLTDKSGKLTEFIKPTAENGVYAIYDLAVDAAHDKLYLASAGSPYYKGFSAGAYGDSGVVEFQLSSGKFLHKYLFPADTQGLQPTSITVGKDGRVYVVDGNHGQIYRLDGGKLKLLTQNPKLTAIRALAVSDDGRTLYLADYARGIFGIDLTDTKAFGLGRNPDKLVLGGIAGMYYYDGCLVVIESGMVPQRVMRLKLAKDGRSVVSAMPLDVAQPAFTMPTVGAIDGDHLYFIANSEKGLYDRYGVLKQPDKLQPTRIFRSNLRFAWNQKGIATGMSELPKGTPRSGLNMPPADIARPAGDKKDEKH